MTLNVKEELDALLADAGRLCERLADARIEAAFERHGDLLDEALSIVRGPEARALALRGTGLVRKLVAELKGDT